MRTPLPAKAKELLDQATFVTVATTNADGSPQTSILWATYDGDDILLSTVEGRTKPRNWRRDPRTSVIVFDPDDPYSYVEARGTVELTTDGGPELIQTLSRKYTGRPYKNDAPGAVRLVARLRPEHVVTH
ncbi:MAG: PPOX class F420-dependent oxidoreductase [Jatrophihabitans sp.]|nr:MAG: PPOX class F420-dependent oxidoreductase [Jatrophihabitans sp.]